jgi:hypothetical protein
MTGRTQPTRSTARAEQVSRRSVDVSGAVRVGGTAAQSATPSDNGTPVARPVRKALGLDARDGQATEEGAPDPRPEPYVSKEAQSS